MKCPKSHSNFPKFILATTSIWATYLVKNKKQPHVHKQKNPSNQFKQTVYNIKRDKPDLKIAYHNFRP